MMRSTEYFAKISEMAKRPGVINLGVGEPNFKPPENILEAYRNAAKKEDAYKYTPIKGLPELREKVLEKLKMENKVSAEDVIITTGAVGAVFNSLMAHLQKGDEVMLFSPHYGRYSMIAGFKKAKAKKIALKENRPDLDALEKEISKKTRAIVLNSPSNPSGIVWTRDEIKRLAEITDANELLLVSDEVYEKFTYDGRKHVSPGEFSDRVLTVNSFSKTYGLPGMRVGYLAGAEELLKPALDIHLASATCVPYPAQQAAIEALNTPCPVDLASFDKRRKMVVECLENAGAEFIPPEGAFYCYAYVKENALKLGEKLMEKNVLVMPNAIFGDERNAIRLSYAADAGLLEKGLRLIRTHLGRAD